MKRRTPRAEIPVPSNSVLHHKRLPIASLLLFALFMLAPAGGIGASAQTFEEPELSFVLRTPPGFTGSKNVEGEITTWKIRNEKSGDKLGPDELVSITVTALARTPGRDPGQEFRAYVDKFATSVLHGGAVGDFRSVRVAGKEGFDARAQGVLDMGAGARPAVARILLMEVEDKHVLASAIAFGKGDQAYAAFGTQDGPFAPAETMITTGPLITLEASKQETPAGPRDPKLSGQEPAPSGHAFPLGALLGLVALAGAGLLLRALILRKYRPAPVAPVPVAQSTADPALQAASPQASRFCTECGTRVAGAGPCPKCGAPE